MIPKKPAPHVMRGGNRFSEKIVLHQNLERDSDSKKSYTALVSEAIRKAVVAANKIYFRAMLQASIVLRNAGAAGRLPLISGLSEIRLLSAQVGQARLALARRIAPRTSG
jgi:hypothetical protein